MAGKVGQVLGRLELDFAVFGLHVFGRGARVGEMSEVVFVG